jgi:hypothetical protein
VINLESSGVEAPDLRPASAHTNGPMSLIVHESDLPRRLLSWRYQVQTRHQSATNKNRDL